VRNILRRGLSLLPLLLVACAGQQRPLPVPEGLLQEDPFNARYKVHCDNDSGTTVCVMTGNALPPFSPRYPLLTLGAVSEVDKRGAARYFLRTIFVSTDRWLNIGPGSSLRITVDGAPIRISGAGSQVTRYAGEDKKLYEVALFDTAAATLRAIAKAEVVTVSLQGDFLLEKRFSNVNTLYFRQFVQHYLDTSPATDP
jgi:hypothetical protein